jgi:hypothetical protein
MPAQKMKLEIIESPLAHSLSPAVEKFISKITNPETMQIQFEVVKTNDGPLKFYAFILFDGELTK